jgi:hypothetical protein
MYIIITDISEDNVTSVEFTAGSFILKNTTVTYD